MKKEKWCANIIYRWKQKGGVKMEKKHHDAGRIFTKVIATILAILMIFAVAATLIYYVIARLV